MSTKFSSIFRECFYACSDIGSMGIGAFNTEYKKKKTLMRPTCLFIEFKNKTVNEILINFSFANETFNF